jgi:hypothetical protein
MVRVIWNLPPATISAPRSRAAIDNKSAIETAQSTGPPKQGQSDFGHD